jgi:hypothetical protein
LIHDATGASAMAYTLSWPQNTLSLKLNVKGLQSAADCEMKRK